MGRCLRLFALLILAAAAAAENPPAPLEIAVDWTRLRDLEFLVARVESEARFVDKREREPVSRTSWGTRLQIMPTPDLIFPGEKPDQASELAFLGRYLRDYRDEVERAKESAVALAQEESLLKDAEGPFPVFAQRMVARFPLEDSAVFPKDPPALVGKKHAAGEIVRYLTRLPAWEKEFQPLLDASPEDLAQEWERRLAEAKKLIKRFDIGKDIGTGELHGTSLFDVRLGPTGLTYTTMIVNGLKTYPVVGADGAPWKVNGSPLLVCSEKTLPDINSYVKDVKNEYLVFRYRQLGFGDDKSKDVIRLMGVRLFLGPRYFLFHRDRVILFVKNRPGR